MSEQTFTNRLIHETSPYLRQHANNPVDWYPWGEEAITKAKTENKPIHLSIGYAACHWCHVMAHESFENPATATIMNDHFVNIKVDREERPDLDAIYMQAVQSMTGHGGWPMTTFLTPDGQPFYGGTYFPPEPRYGMPSFTQVLNHIINLWETRRDDLVENAAQLTEAIQRTGQVAQHEHTLDARILDAAFAALRTQYDQHHGGWGKAPKFPQPNTIEFALRHYLRVGNDEALRMVQHTLDKMARGGMYDQLGGGFHRYSVDDHWLVPHFEKMLYDNAQLAKVYLHAYLVTGNQFYRQIVEETLDYVVREMTSPEGGFYSTQDADSLLPQPHGSGTHRHASSTEPTAGEGGHKEEGAFYVWSADEVRAALGADAVRWMQLYDVTARGNWEGKNILNQPRSVQQVARVLGMAVEELQALAQRGRTTLLAIRERRPQPARDEKVLVSWNGLMLGAFAEAGRVLKREDYLDVARCNAQFVSQKLLQGDRLLHVYKDGQAKIEGFAEDYALYADGLLELFRSTFDAHYLEQAQQLVGYLLEHFTDQAGGGVFQTSDVAETLIARPKDLFDEAVPSSNGVTAQVLQRLSVLVGDNQFIALAEQIVGLVAAALPQYPTALGSMLIALDNLVAPPQEVAVLGVPSAPDTQALVAQLDALYLPHTTVVVAAPGDPLTTQLPLLADRPQREGKATAYVCRAYACQQPTTQAEELRQQLATA